MLYLGVGVIMMLGACTLYEYIIIFTFVRVPARSACRRLVDHNNYETIRDHTRPYETIRDHMIPYGTICQHNMSPSILLFEPCVSVAGPNLAAR